MGRTIPLLLALLASAAGLFEDQAFKFDWKQSFVGESPGNLE